MNVKHPSMRGLEEHVRGSLIEPAEVRRSRSDSSVYLFYGRYHEQKPFIRTVVKHLNADGFIITAYLTRRMAGDLIWKEN